MAWRETLLRRVGPGLLGGLTFGRWARLLADNRLEVAPSCLPRALAITCQSIQNSLFHLLDERQLRGQLDALDVPPPLFLLGHWRQGTTHLHNLLTVDPRFAFPNNYEALFPLSFLTAERLHSRVIDFFMPKRRPMDNMEWNMWSPQEDEFALCISSLMSPCMGWAFPRRRAHYDRYLTFRDVPEREIVEWQRALMALVKKLTWKSGRPLVLKSPPHTCRIKLLLELFPDAKFVRIHRNPYDVFVSSRRTFQVNFELHRLQNYRADEFDAWILQQYARMYAAFFEERALVAAGRLHEVRYEDLERDPMGQVQQIYEALQLPDFSVVERPLRRYVESIAGYQKSTHAELPGAMRERVTHEWRACFDEWGYAAD